MLSIGAPTSQGYTSGFTNGMAGFSGELPFDYGYLQANVSGTATYTYLGSEAGYSNSFVTSQGDFTNHGTTALDSTINQVLASPGILDFGFSSNGSLVVTNAQNLQGNGSAGKDEGVFGIAQGIKVGNILYQYLLIYNDPVVAGDHDYNDLVVGVNFTPTPPSPVPLPAAAWLFGSALLGFISLSNRRKV